MKIDIKEWRDAVVHTTPAPAAATAAPSDEEIIADMEARGWKYMDEEERTDIIKSFRTLFARYGQIPATSAEQCGVCSGLGWIGGQGGTPCTYCDPVAAQVSAAEPVAYADKVAFEQAMKAGKGCDVWPTRGDGERETIALFLAAPVAASEEPWKPLWDDIMSVAESKGTPTAARMKEWAWQLQRLAAQVHPIQWPTMPPSKGQSHVLFEDGYAEGWAKCSAECQKAAANGNALTPAEEDQQMFNWMIAEECRVETLPLGNGNRYRVHWPDCGECGEWQSEWFTSPCEAIRAAMQPTTGSEE